MSLANTPELMQNHAGWLIWADVNGRKIPIVKGWPTAELRKLEDLPRGVLTGFRPDNIITVVDLDDVKLPEGVESIQGLDDLPNSVRAFVEWCDTYTEVSPSGKGLHILFVGPWRLDDGKWTGKLNYPGLSCTMEVWSYSKRWVAMTGDVLCGEIHANTKVTDEILLNIQAMATFGMVGEPKEPEEAEEPAKPNAAQVNLHASQENLKSHAIAAMDSIGKETPTVRGEDPEQVMLRVCRTLIRLGVDPDDAVNLILGHWNTNYTFVRGPNGCLNRDPHPWGFSEIQHKVADADKFVEDNGLGRAAQYESVRILLTPIDPNEKVEGDDNEWVDWADVGEHVDHKLKFIWDKRLALGELTLMHCAPKVGKTTFALELMSPDTSFLGATKVSSPQTLFVSEEPWHIWLDRLTTKVPGIAAGGRTVKIVRPRPMLGGQDSTRIAAFFKGVTDQIELSKKTDHPVQLVIIDPLATFTGGDENDAVFISPFLHRLRDIATTYNVSVLLIHHSRKSLNSGTDFDSHNARGCGAISSVPDNLIQLGSVADKPSRGKTAGCPAHAICHIAGRTTERTELRYIMVDNRLRPFVPSVTPVDSDEALKFDGMPNVTYDRPRSKTPDSWNGAELSIGSDPEFIQATVDAMDLRFFIARAASEFKVACQSAEDAGYSLTAKTGSFKIRALFGIPEVLDLIIGRGEVLSELSDQLRVTQLEQRLGGSFNDLMRFILVRAYSTNAHGFGIEPKSEYALEDLKRDGVFNITQYLRLTV